MSYLTEINEKYEKIVVLNEPERTQQLVELMTTMEKQCNIPMVRNTVWEEKNKKVIAMYRKISMSRNFIEE